MVHCRSVMRLGSRRKIAEWSTDSLLRRIRMQADSICKLLRHAMLLIQLALLRVAFVYRSSELRRHLAIAFLACHLVVALRHCVNTLLLELLRAVLHESERRRENP